MPWSDTREVAATPATEVPMLTALLRGARGRCPCCGEGRLFSGYLKLAPACDACGTRFEGIRADDAPPYFTILLAGHVLLPPVFWIEKAYQPPMWLHMAVWLPLFAIVCALLLHPVKGAVVGWMMRIGLTGNDQGPVLSAEPRRGPGDA